MRIAMFYHSLRSCWNHGNAHFLRGVVSELLARGHQVTVYEPERGWSLDNLMRQEGAGAAFAYRAAYPGLDSVRYRLERLDLDQALDRVDLVVVHEWNSPELVARLGAHRCRARYQLLFHDTHHRSVTSPREMARYRLDHYDGVLAFGEAIRRVYLERGWAARAWTWHEAADARVFYPRRMVPRGDLVWIGSWGDDERTAELGEFLLTPAKLLGLSGAVYGVRYPDEGRAAIKEAGLHYRGWLPNHKVPEVMSSYRVTVHVPRRPYVKALPGVPTIRMFEALASGVPLVSAPWRDDEGLFTAGRDYLVARNGREMARLVRAVLADTDLGGRLADSGRRTVLARHTCGHRVDQLLGIVRELRRKSGAREQAQHAAQGAA